MGSRVQGLGTLSALLLVAWLLVVPGRSDAAAMCPPITISDLTASPEAAPDDTAAADSGDPAAENAEGPASTTTTTQPPPPPCDHPFVYPMTFPVAGGGVIGSPFGAPRDGGRRHHLGNDLSAPKLQPIVAVADGTVSMIGDDVGISGYRVHIRHDDGWSSLYIHLNNDTAGTDDGNGIGIRPGLTIGDRVQAGEVIGWNGDSGNAENTEPHLHFELRDPSGTPIDPAASLRAATGSPLTFRGPFADVDLDDDEPSPLILLLSRGVPTWCDDTRLYACPNDPAPWSAVAGWLDALVADVTRPDSEQASLECDDVDDCPAVVTEADIARGLVWARLHQAYRHEAWWIGSLIPDAGWQAPPTPPPALPSQIAVGRAHELLGGAERCLPPPDAERPLTATEAAGTLLLYLGWDEVSNCPTNSAKS